MRLRKGALRAHPDAQTEFKTSAKTNDQSRSNPTHVSLRR
jgi:hypothetical protein